MLRSSRFQALLETIDLRHLNVKFRAAGVTTVAAANASSDEWLQSNVGMKKAQLIKFRQSLHQSGDVAKGSRNTRATPGNGGIFALRTNEDMDFL